MLNFLKGLLGTGALGADSFATGVTYLRAELAKVGANPDALPAQLYRDLAQHAQRYADNMAELMPDDKPVTHFVNHLDYIGIALADLLAGEPVQVDDGIAEILARYKLVFRRALG